MRLKHLMGFVLCLAVAMIPASAASAATATQTIDSELGGKNKPKFDKKKFKKTSLEVETRTTNAEDPAGIPPKAFRALIKFDRKNVKFNTKAKPGCNPSSIAGTTTEGALAACGKAKVGKGNAIAALPFGPGGARTDFPVVVNAFNSAAGKGILLHSRVDALGTTTVLTGTLRGTKLDIAIPPLGGGVGAIAQFQTKVKAKDYVQGRCKHKKMKTKATFSFTDAPQAKATDKQKCKRK